MPTTSTNPRDLVADRLARRAKHFPEVDLAPLDVSSLAPRDAGLAHAIDQAVARRWLTLAAVAETRLRQPWHELQPSVQAALLTGMAQLLLMERIPDHAAINHAVGWVKRSDQPKASGLVNAVLRRIAEMRNDVVGGPLDWPLGRKLLPWSDGRALRFSDPVFDEDPLRRFAQQTSHPLDLLRRWMVELGEDVTAELAAHGLVHPPTIIAGLPEAAWAEVHGEPHERAGFVISDASHQTIADVLARHPGARVQDPTTAEALTLTADLDAALIIDLCAGRGTKTRQLALLHPDARIIATDIDDTRRAALKAAFADHTGVNVIEPSELSNYREQADLVVLDVPCTNTGVIARRPEARYRVSPDSIEGLVGLQRQIIADAIPYLTDRAWMLYATCSIEPAENQAQIDWLTHWHPFKVCESKSALPTGMPGDPPATYSDGGFAALVQRSAK